MQTETCPKNKNQKESVGIVRRSHSFEREREVGIVRRNLSFERESYWYTPPLQKKSL